jgi:hypothetical protein
MDIQEYVAQALDQINAGIATANATNGTRRFMLRRGEPIKFDLAVVNQSISGGKINVTVFGIGCNTSGTAFQRSTEQNLIPGGASSSTRRADSVRIIPFNKLIPILKR